MVRKEFQLQEVIFKEDEYQLWMYSICEGSVDIYSGYGTSKIQKLATLREGQFFGEIGMIGMIPRTATAVAASERVVLDLISYEDLEDYLKHHPENIQLLMKNLSRRLRELTEDLSEIVRITNEALQTRAAAKPAGAYLAERIRNLLSSLKINKTPLAEFVMDAKRKQVLSRETPPMVRYSAGEVIFYAGDHADCMYQIYSGRVGIYSDYKTKNQKLLTELGNEAIFGEMGTLDDMPRSATAVCLENCCVLRIGKENFFQFFQKNPMKIIWIIHQMCLRLRNLTGIYNDVCKTLTELSDQENQDQEENMAWAKLEHFRESQLYASMYDVSSSADWMHNCL